MQNIFLSIVGVIQREEEIDLLSEYLQNIHQVLEGQYSDFEIVIVNNTFRRNLNQKIEKLDPKLKHNTFLLNLSANVNKNHAVVAGLDRANGDYTVIFEFDFYKKAEIIHQLYEKSREGFDIVYLHAKQRETGFQNRFFYKIFYTILKNYSALKIDEKAHNTRIISRRALNSLLRLRENLRYMKAIYSIVGYQTAAIEVEEPLKADPDVTFSDQFKTSLVAISSFTTFLRSMMLWIFIFSIGFLAIVVYNAIKVKMTNIDIFGDFYPAVPGWTFLVVLVSIFFAITCLNLYIMSIYLSNIYQEIKQRPLYLIESVQRF